MKKLYLLRHASTTSPTGLADDLRPLSVKGKEEAKEVGETMRLEHIKPEKWFVSSAKRTTDTCQRILLAGKFKHEPIYDKSLYLASAGEMIRYLNKVDDNPESIIVIAHNPGIEQLLKLLCGSHGNTKALRALNTGYPPATLSVIGVDISSWDELEVGKGQLINVYLTT